MNVLKGFYTSLPRVPIIIDLTILSIVRNRIKEILFISKGFVFYLRELSCFSQLHSARRERSPMPDDKVRHIKEGADEAVKPLLTERKRENINHV